MLEFGQDISFMALVIVAMISDLHLLTKLMWKPVQSPLPNYPERIFSSITKSSIEM